MLEEILTTLTPRQIDAVEHTSGPLLILAGAGTGKTTTITAKIAFMIEKQGIEPEKILALIFSKEAARNMEQKIHELLHLGVDLKVSTFHAFCAELIRNNAEKCGVSEEFTIFEEIDAAILLYKELGITSRNADLYSSTSAKAKDLNISINKFKIILKQKKSLCLSLLKKASSSNFILNVRSA